MWNKRKEEEYPPRPATAASTSHGPKDGGVGASTPGAPSYHMPETRGTAVIGKSVTIKGQIYSQEDLTIDGEMEGSIEVKEHRLTVGPNGKVQAGVKAREIIVLGTINGNVEVSDKIDIRKDARLVGDIKTARIVIEDGAFFKGNIDISRGTAEAPPKPPPPQQKPQQQSAAAQNTLK
jgi:cytoskeletal protein CcmA (bactofilin family)